MTTKEVAKQLGCDIHTITNHANRLFTGKIRNGVKTYFDEKEVTLILDSIKHGKGGSPTARALYEVVQGTETSLTPTLEVSKLTELIRRSYERIDEIKSAEIARLKQEKETLQVRLSEAGEWWSVKRVLIETGVEYPWRPLREYSRENGFSVEKTFDKNYGEVNAYHVDVWNAVYGVEL
jgi:transposase